MTKFEEQTPVRIVRVPDTFWGRFAGVVSGVMHPFSTTIVTVVGAVAGAPAAGVGAVAGPPTAGTGENSGRAPLA
jgi:hypothetical protein